jgi:Ice-binding-like
MHRYVSWSKAWMWFMASLVVGFMAGCDGKIFGGTSAGGAGGGGGGSPGPAGAAPALGAAGAFGGIGGAAGMTNQGVSTVITGAQGQPVSIGTTGASTLMTGFHDNVVPYAPPNGCIYTETGANVGAVNGTINTAAPPPNPVSCGAATEGNATTFAAATAGLAAAQAAYNDLAGRLGALAIPAQLGGTTLAPGIYNTASGAFLITGGADLTLDAGGNANAVWVFQMASTLTVGSAGLPRSVILVGGAQPKNVFWQVGAAATINGTGGGTMVGTIISQATTTFSTGGNPCCTTLNGRALALTASVTMANTVINVPTP